MCEELKKIFNTTLKIAAAAFFHDIGKLVDSKEEEKIEAKYLQKNQQLYQKYNSFQNRFTHIHALYSVAFFDSINELHDTHLPKEIKDYTTGNLETKEDCFINLVGMHHKPETPTQKIITIADWISSGMDRDQFKNIEDKTAFSEYKKTRLLPLFEQINIYNYDKKEISGQSNGDENKAKKSFKNKDHFKYRYDLKSASPETIFPIPKDECSNSVNEYKNLYNKFKAAFLGLQHKDNFKLWFKHADSLCQEFLTAVPAARAGKVVHDVSLYDHLKTTSAIASSLFLYHKINNTLNEHHFGSHFTTEDTKQDWCEEKFLLIGGDLYGIQNFIFANGGETNRYRAKLLRGRSFSVSLMSQLAAEFICDSIGLPHTSIIMSVAGKFTILAPNLDIVKNELKIIKEKINQWFHNTTYSETTMGINFMAISPIELVTKEKFENNTESQKNNTFFSKWTDFQQKMGENKSKKIDLLKFGGPVKVFDETNHKEKPYLETFDNDLKNSLCPLCRKRPATKKASKTSQFTKNNKGLDKSFTQGCSLCRDQIFIGENLVKNRFMGVYKKSDIGIKQNDTNIIPFFDEYKIVFFDEIKTFINEVNLGIFTGFYQINQNLEKQEENKSKTNSFVSKLYINGYVPKFTDEDKNNALYNAAEKNDKNNLEILDGIVPGKIKTLHHIALNSKKIIFKTQNQINHKDDKQEFDYSLGVDALGVLKADVDNLGLLMATGLEKSRYTLSRMATLSRQLNQFFSLWLPHYLKTNKNKKGEFLYTDIYTVFAGGDDLFLVGPWNKMLSLSIDINEKFKKYVCGNLNIHLSAGISVHKTNEPIHKLAQTSEAALEKSKDFFDKKISKKDDSSANEQAQESTKNSITFFNQTVSWDDIVKLYKIKKEIENLSADDPETGPALSKSTVYKLNDFINMVEKEYKIQEGIMDYNIADLNALKWKSHLAYSIARNSYPRLNNKNKRQKNSQKLIKNLTDWLSTNKGNLRIPLWTHLYNNRR